MEEEVICLDTSVLIEYFRKVKKSKSFLFELSENYRSFAVSVITEYEVYHGSNFEQDFFWDQFFSKIKTVTFNSEVNRIVIKIERELKQTGEKHTEDRKQFASLHSWESNVNKIFNCISETIKNNDEHQRKN
jgi:predicted nucleic acid-binding protein